MGPDAGDRWLRRGHLHRIHRGVYLYGRPSPHEWTYEMAAVLACGNGAVLSHRSAAYLWHLLPHPANPRPVHVTVPGRDPGRKPGIRIHRVKHLHPSEARIRYRIPVTSPGRTLLDLACEATSPELDIAASEAYAKRLVRQRDLAFLTANHRRHRGARRLRALISDPPALTRSDAERRLLDLVRRAGLPEPEGVNVPVAPYVVDFLWREQRLVVEVDGFAFHSSRAAFERDRRRDADLTARGFRVIRVTWRQIIREPEASLVRLAQALVRGAA
jgi:very-short-patch-repair endonuclease